MPPPLVPLRRGVLGVRPFVALVARPLFVALVREALLRALAVLRAPAVLELELGRAAARREPLDFLAAVDLRADDLRAVDLRAVDFLAAVDFRAGDFLALDFLAAVDLRAVDFFAAVDFRAGDFRAADFLALDDDFERPDERLPPAFELRPVMGNAPPTFLATRPAAEPTVLLTVPTVLPTVFPTSPTTSPTTSTGPGI